MVGLFLGFPWFPTLQQIVKQSKEPTVAFARSDRPRGAGFVTQTSSHLASFFFFKSLFLRENRYYMVLQKIDADSTSQNGILIHGEHDQLLALGSSGFVAVVCLDVWPDEKLRPNVLRSACGRGEDPQRWRKRTCPKIEHQQIATSNGPDTI